MQGFLFIVCAGGISAGLAAFFRSLATAAPGTRIFLNTGAWVLAALTLLWLQSATSTSVPAIHEAVVAGSHGRDALTVHDLLSMLCCAVLGASAYAHLSGRIKGAQTSSLDGKTIQSGSKPATLGGRVIGAMDNNWTSGGNPPRK